MLISVPPAVNSQLTLSYAKQDDDNDCPQSTFTARALHPQSYQNSHPQFPTPKII